MKREPYRGGSADLASQLSSRPPLDSASKDLSVGSGVAPPGCRRGIQCTKVSKAGSGQLSPALILGFRV